MKEQFVTYEVAWVLREKGFDEECAMMFVDKKPEIWYDDYRDDPVTNIRNSTWGDSRFVAAPLWQQVIDWLFFTHGKDIGYSPNKEYLNERILKNNI